MARHGAKRGDRKCQPFTDDVGLAMADVNSRDEFDKIAHGLVPEGMEDQWFAFMEGSVLYLHHSSTGEPHYKVAFKPAACASIACCRRRRMATRRRAPSELIRPTERAS